jgi:methionyl-tRNA formyltransferase
MAGDAASGIAVFQLEAGLDTGPTFVNRSVKIGAHETAGELLERLAEQGARDVVATVAEIGAGTAEATPQSGHATTAAKLTVRDGFVDWQRSAAEIDALVRGVTPEPGAASERDGQRIKLLRGAVAETTHAAGAPGEVSEREGRIVVATGEGSYELLEVQPAGKKPMSAADWWRGQRGAAVRLG